MRRVAALAVLAVLTAIVPSFGVAGAAPAVLDDVGHSSDFNGDGAADLAVGVPLESVGEVGGAGAVNVIYANSAGLGADHDQFWSQDTAGVVGVAEEGDFFGFELTTGDFNGDGFADLAIGAPFEDIEEVDLGFDAGVVHVLYGSPEGLTARRTQLWSQDSAGIRGDAEGEEKFGASLAGGDLNGDGYADLAVGVREGEGEELEEAGAVNVLYGSDRGLRSLHNQIWSQESPGIVGDAYPLDLFGAGLAAADLDGDAIDDLAIGVLGEDLGIGDAGAVHVLFGTTEGLTSERSQYWTQDSPGIQGKAEYADLFGLGVSAGDFDGDGYADLVIEVFNESVNGDDGAGAINVLYGSIGGPSPDRNQLFTQDSAGMPDEAEPYDGFGNPTSAGDFNGDGIDDLAIGVQSEDLPSGVPDGGAVTVLFGGASGLTTSGTRNWTQNSLTIKDAAQPQDHFGTSLTVANMDGDAYADLAVGSREDLGEARDAGAVNVLYGAEGGLSDLRNQLWTQNTTGIAEVAEQGDFFGIPVAAAGG